MKQIDSFNIARLHLQEDFNFQTRVRDLAQECLVLETNPWWMPIRKVSMHWMQP